MLKLLWMLVVGCWWFSECAAASGAVTLADGGKSPYRIIVPTSALPSERYAAEELQKYLEKLSGASLPIAADSEAPDSNEILLGDNARLAKLGLEIDFASLGTDGFVLRTKGNRLVIAGGKPRGTLNGVHVFLEEQLGIRWFTPETEFVPRTNRVSLPDLNETVVPPLEYREVFWTEMFRNADFAAR